MYQTFDTPNIKSLNRVLAKDPTKSGLAGKIPEYVLMVDGSGGAIVPLQVPEGTGPFNFPSYKLNPNAKKMLSLSDGTVYYNGKTEASGADTSKLIDGFTAGASQINAVNQFVKEQLEYGPFVIGDVTLTIDKKLSDAGVYVYKAAGFL